MKIIYKLLNYFFKASSKKECHQILMAYNTYYQGLSPKNKEIFQIRTLIFLFTTNFDSKHGFELTRKMKIIISSAFVQITFGLNFHTLSKFKLIFVTPVPYAYKHSEVLMYGDVNLHTKQINMTWPVVKKGFEINNDALNLAIHEFGHCLIFENAARSYLSRIFKRRAFSKWKKVAHKKLLKIKAKENKVLRDYAGTNLIELFSVSLEAFFEKPHHFYNHEPELYLSMAELLKQDPRNRTNPLQWERP
ncbi:zinc-dependent peptidase [Aureibaculum sp. 2210JD6-5]|uniref:zinc-dependent peptidase n=1 Tax=Aureibaculum sp. 2210JD6-5 TaxID=3103957 RepID=UPI002AAC54E2|nr:zinc-dependent peptidase [Aureibaculum sp. 2210JD6-5]MDY7396143.1 zinc-dependent peptidase [Aureibaculum sp. 2210JD6-5]